MLLTAAVSLSLLARLPHWPHKPGDATHAEVSRSLYKLGPWLIAVHPDRFAGVTTCQLHTRDVSLQRDTVIFRVAPQGDTTAAVFRIDSGPPHRVAETFDTVEAHGFFPQRGWVVDPNGGEAALPVSYVSGAKVVSLRVTPTRRPRRFMVDRLAEAEASARALGCPI
ncbi:MAG: hypothetical protein JWO83_3814 [Caulobacteraceae bacterium]|nr:hypothetical protein [Caulobacteraceae bacterium]